MYHIPCPSVGRNHDKMVCMSEYVTGMNRVMILCANTDSVTNVHSAKQRALVGTVLLIASTRRRTQLYCPMSDPKNE